jgi:hypothetical protein
MIMSMRMGHRKNHNWLEVESVTTVLGQRGVRSRLSL